ncbi:hypothetical protein PF005_g25747 [Phytophthora fragariae]|uniref:Secreted protein n=1 Tax=Phytophthora fragariae TaxID=53985 RepID=A0A6A3QF02_9STRA|nr:hypothetical protein PF003_g14849 [Phytophthora fragariae]KAE8923325.1 hypothetical protein PF009_g26422 [Phytophthora fragariae]KAE8975314.1 hypothetical protein PF011_g24528 [Phytophthora fragariae]KAE9073018.1 hypothetical protein PF010_g25251 [Phytophthora fragariae]KAE9073470.1 hypothetical protein PF007_g25792 [Phytophthora fragariae]
MYFVVVSGGLCVCLLCPTLPVYTDRPCGCGDCMALPPVILSTKHDIYRCPLSTTCRSLENYVEFYD